MKSVDQRTIEDRSRISKRQEVFMERLKTIAKRAAGPGLPLRVEAIYAFGSFLRAKEHPGDLDLIVHYSHFHPLWDRFTDLMGYAIRLHEKDWNSYATPREALQAFVASTADEPHMPIYSEWLGDCSWEKIYRSFIPLDAYSWDKTSKRVLLADLPRVHISNLVKGLKHPPTTAKAYELVWSRNEPEVTRNVLSILSPTRLTENLILELKNFEKQLAEIRLELTLFTELCHFLLDIPAESYPKEDIAVNALLRTKALEFLPKQKTKTLEAAIKNIGRTTFREDFALDLEFEAEEVRRISLDQLKETTEAKRIALRDAHQEHEVVSTILRLIMQWRRESPHDPYVSRLTLPDWVAFWTIKGVPKTSANEATIRRVLRMLNLPEDRVLSDKRYGRTQYELSEGEERRRMVEQGNIIADAEKKYRRELRPTIIQTNKELELHVEVRSDLRPIRVTVMWHIMREGKRPEEVAKATSWCRERGFKIPDYAWAAAYLDVKLDDCHDVEEMKSKLSRILK